MNFTAEQKTQLAKLMATENLTVQHQKISTARFDPQNRVLYLPIWQNMTGVIYDLLVGHEVGHALYTPAEGWHDAVADNTKGKNYKGFLNVVEDARIEKKVKRKYPGLATAFKLAYQELSARDFFGIKGREINDMPFIDRLNLFSKSQWSATWINFTAQEEVYVKKVQAIETWEDVIKVTDEIYGYSQSEQMELAMSDFESFGYSDDPYGDYDMDTDFDLDSDSDEFGESDTETDSDGDGEKSEDDANKDNDGDGNGENTGKESKSNTEQDGNNQETQSDKDGDSINHDKTSSESSQDQFSPKCETDDNYRKNETMLLDEKCKDYLYVHVPKPILKNIVTPAARVQELLTKFYNMAITEKWMAPEIQTKLLNEFKRKNERYIGLLAKEFEMRKAAKAFSKSKLSDTGDIDINKLASYKFDDNIFRKVMLTPKGKSHGLVLLLDRSGSMSSNMAGSIEQILVLAMFCRKVNIPFVVYGFGDCSATHMIDTGLNSMEYNNNAAKCFEEKENHMALSSVRLREYINSTMTNAEFTKAVKNMLLVKRSFEGGRYHHTDVPRADTESLSNTPATQALIATAEIMKEFKRKHNLDMTSLVMVQDGDADWTNTYYRTESLTKYDGTVWTGLRAKNCDFYGSNVFLVDAKNKYQKKINNTRESVNQTVLDWFAKVTGSKIFGFFIINEGRSGVRYAIGNKYTMEDGTLLDDVRHKNYYVWESKQKALLKEFRSEKFLSTNATGYNQFFLVSGGEDLKTEEEEIEIEGKFTARKLATAFAKMNKKKAVNRVLVSKFIQGIAA